MYRCGRHLGAVFACAVLLAGGVTAAEGPSVAVQDTALYVEVDREAEKLLAAARQAAAAGQWREAIDAYQRVVEFSPPAATQPVASAVPGAAVWLPIQQVAARELCRSLDARGLALYREAHDAPARREFERALAARDRQGLRQVAARYLATSSGDDALAALGSLAFERGHFVSALAAWRTLLEHCPEPGVSVVAVKARVWACLRALGRTHEADALRRELLADHPQATLRAGGREVAVAEFLAAPLALAADPPLAEWPTLGGRAGHAATAQPIGGVGSRRWTFRVPNALAGDAVPPAMHATVSGGRVFVANEAAVVALDAATGRLAWMYPDAPEEPQPPAPDEAVNAVACDGGRAFARVGGAVVAFHAATGRVLWRHPLREKPAAAPPPEPPADAPADDEAKKDDAPPPLEPALLATPPVVAGGRVIVGLTVLGDEARASLLALDAATGRRLWRTFVCSRTISAFRGLGGTPSVPALDGGTAYFCTNLGAVAAVDAATGSLRWLHRYPAVHTYLRDALVARGWRWHTEPPAVVGGRVVVAPQDAGRLLALEGHDGTTLWTAPRLGARHVVVDARGRVFVAGRSVAALDVRTGKRLWAV
ncbi:PQQ-binding-like beta-propeller repeat protein, partial [bacterium]|nr:PQQ-binding-like beta-propeller repeat protein [bacterium]